jgi:hypothetical protein
MQERLDTTPEPVLATKGATTRTLAIGQALLTFALRRQADIGRFTSSTVSGVAATWQSGPPADSPAQICLRETACGGVVTPAPQ